MTAIHVAVTAEQIAEAGWDPSAWADPVEAALAEVTGQDVDIDGGGPDGPCVATIGQDDWTLVIDLPEAASRWLDERWDGKGRGEPFEFDIDVPGWIQDLITSHLSIEALRVAARAAQTVARAGAPR